MTTSASAPLPASVLEALARYDTPTICNAMEIVAVNFPPWRTVYFYCWSWQRDGVWQRINEVLVKKVRKKAGRKERPCGSD